MSAPLLIFATLWLAGIAAIGWALTAPQRSRRRANDRLLREALRDLQAGGIGVAPRTATPRRAP